jgi:hypothetical protein
MYLLRGRMINRVMGEQISGTTLCTGESPVPTTDFTLKPYRVQLFTLSSVLYYIGCKTDYL